MASEAREYEGCGKDPPRPPAPSAVVFLSSCIDAFQKKKKKSGPSLPDLRTPLPTSFLFLSHLLSLGPNYMVDRVIDTRETESPQQAARGPS